MQGKEYPLNILVLSTRYRSPAYGSLNSAKRTGINVFGRSRKPFNDKWDIQGTSTLYSIISHGFPNFFFGPTTQFGQSPNNIKTLNITAKYIPYFIKKAEEKVKGFTVIDQTVEAEKRWAIEAVKRAANLAVLSVCTPGYTTSDGEFNKPN